MAQVNALFSDSVAVVRQRGVDMVLQWIPSDQERLPRPLSLFQLWLKNLMDGSNRIRSLDGLPEAIKDKIVTMLMKRHKMHNGLLRTYITYSTTEIHLGQYCWASEKAFLQVFTRCSINLLKVLELDLSAGFMSDNILLTITSKSENIFSSLEKLAVRRARRITNMFLTYLPSLAPILRSVDLSGCSLITADGINHLSKHLYLEELYIDGCQNIDVLKLDLLDNLVTLSVASVPRVCDSFITNQIHACGRTIGKLVLSGCSYLTNVSLSVIGSHCPNLYFLDIENLWLLDDSSIESLANGCRFLSTLRLSGNHSFSDEAIAAFVQSSGRFLTELVLNNVSKVGFRTAISIAINCRLLKYLDLSSCPLFTDEALGLIVDSCDDLTILRLYNRRRVSDRFILGHRNTHVTIIREPGAIMEDLVMTESF